ncbi:MAG: hypothetical protein WB816_12395 [Methylocystis sp.]
MVNLIRGVTKKPHTISRHYPTEFAINAMSFTSLRPLAAAFDQQFFAFGRRAREVRICTKSIARCFGEQSGFCAGVIFAAIEGFGAEALPRAIDRGAIPVGPRLKASRKNRVALIHRGWQKMKIVNATAGATFKTFFYAGYEAR